MLTLTMTVISMLVFLILGLITGIKLGRPRIH
jgi:hypothetical protein